MTSIIYVSVLAVVVLIASGLVERPGARPLASENLPADELDKDIKANLREALQMLNEQVHRGEQGHRFSGGAWAEG